MSPKSWMYRNDGGDRFRVISDPYQNIELDEMDDGFLESLTDDELENLRLTTKSHLVLNTVLVERAQRQLAAWQAANL